MARTARAQLNMSQNLKYLTWESGEDRSLWRNGMKVVMSAVMLRIPRCHTRLECLMSRMNRINTSCSRIDSLLRMMRHENARSLCKLARM